MPSSLKKRSRSSCCNNYRIEHYWPSNGNSLNLREFLSSVNYEGRWPLPLQIPTFLFPISPYPIPTSFHHFAYLFILLKNEHFLKLSTLLDFLNFPMQLVSFFANKQIPKEWRLSPRKPSFGRASLENEKKCLAISLLKTQRLYIARDTLVPGLSPTIPPSAMSVVYTLQHCQSAAATFSIIILPCGQKFFVYIPGSG